MDPLPLHPDSERLRLELDILASELEGPPPEAPVPAPTDDAPPDEAPPDAPPASPDLTLTLIVRRTP